MSKASSSPAKKQKTAKSSSRDEPRITDPRFANIQSDPRFRLPGRKNKVKLDKRFSRVLEDEDFTKRAKVDRYGRPLENSTERTRLKRKYEFEEDEEQEQEEPSGSDDDDDEEDVPDDDDEVQRELNRVDNARDLLRQGRDSDSSSASSDETSSSDDDDYSDNEDDAADKGPTIGPASQGDIPMGEVTSRIAIVNLDWDNIRAADIMAVINSFLPPTGTLLKVSIYPSEFGKERLEREEMEGPPREIFASTGDPADDNDEDDEEDDSEAESKIKDSLLDPDTGAEFDSAALRQYQLDRLRYYYCVLTFSSPSVAEHVYSAVDGTEYLTTANFFDLRFVPDDTDFSSDNPKEECTTIPDDYRPNDFVTDALQHSKVRLTWDADDGSRKETIARAFKGGRKEIDENDLKAYLASDSSSEEEEEDNETSLSKKEVERQRMRAALGLAPEPIKKSSSKGAKKEKAPVGDMQITFTSGFSAPTEENDQEGDSKKKKQKNRGVFENSPEPNETTVEKYVRKERERKQRRKDKMKTGRDGAALDDDDAADDIGETHGNGSEAGDLGFDDPFFATATANEPSAQEEKAASNRLRKEERLKKKKEREAEEEAEKKQRAELELLMVDDDAEVDDTGKPVRKIRHFDMKEIERAEKLARKKGKKQKGKKPAKGDAAAAAAQGQDASNIADDDDERFKVDTSDPRFARLFDSHEYAIDPTNPRFKGTKGMREVLEEGRRRRDKKQKGSSALDPTVDDEGQEKDKKDKKKSKTGKSAESGNIGHADVKSLVEKIKMRSK